MGQDTLVVSISARTSRCYGRRPPIPYMEKESQRPAGRRLLFMVNSPGQAHTWRFVIRGLLARQHEVRILARDYGATPLLLRSFGLECSTFQTLGQGVWRLLGAPYHLRKCHRLARLDAPHLIIGFGLDAAVTAALLGKPCVAFFDDEHTLLQNRLTSMFATSVVTPDTFERTVGHNHVRLKGYKELAYLHPDYFRPDERILDEMKIGRNEPYVIVRFKRNDSIHDIAWHSLPVSDRIEFVKRLARYARVFISPEGPLPPALEDYRLAVPYDRIHHALYYAQMLVSDSGTMTTEAAVLGVPAVIIHPMVGHGSYPHVFAELEDKYGLIYSFREIRKGLEKSIGLLKNRELKQVWSEKRQRLLADKTDVAGFLTDFIHRCAGLPARRVMG